MVAATQDKIDYARLKRAFKSSRKAMEYHRKMRVEYIKEFVGPHYSSGNSRNKAKLLNMMQLAVSIKTQQLAPRRPRCLATTWRKDLKAVATDLELGINETVKKIELGKSLYDVVQEAMFGMGIMKIGLDVSGSVTDEDGSPIYAGQVYCDPVGFGDFVFDPKCRNLAQTSLIGSRTFVRMEYVQNNQLFDDRVKANVRPLGEKNTSSDGNTSEELWNNEEFEASDTYGDWVELWDLYLPYERKLVTFASTSQSCELMTEPLLEADWSGPPHGPYRVLAFTGVPGNPLPVPPASMFYDLDREINGIMDKIQSRVKNAKKCYGIAGPDDANVGRFQNCRDGEAFRLDGAFDMQPVEVGGLDQQMLAYALQLKSLFSYMAGNLDIQGGLAPQSDTLGQDRLMSASASRQIDDMQDRVLDFTSGCMRDIMHYLWSDPLLNIPITKTMGEMSITKTITPESLQGEVDEYEIEIDPYSAPNTSPASRLQTMGTIFSSFITPFIGQLEAQGASVDMVNALKVVAKLSDFKELNDVVKFQGPPMPGERNTASARSGQTHSIYERRNVSASKPDTSDQDKIQNMMAADSKNTASI